MGVNGSQVRVGIEAPKDITVHRNEIYERIHAEQGAKKTQSADDDNKGDDTDE